VARRGDGTGAGDVEGAEARVGGVAGDHDVCGVTGDGEVGPQHDPLGDDDGHVGHDAPRPPRQQSGGELGDRVEARGVVGRP
jgi:hypothetical protein